MIFLKSIFMLQEEELHWDWPPDFCWRLSVEIVGPIKVEGLFLPLISIFSFIFFYFYKVSWTFWDFFSTNGIFFPLVFEPSALAPRRRCFWHLLSFFWLFIFLKFTIFKMALEFFKILIFFFQIFLYLLIIYIRPEIFL